MKQFNAKEADDGGQIFIFLLDAVREIVEEPTDTNEKLLVICKLLKNNVPHYNWVGFYLVDQSRKSKIFSASRQLNVNGSSDEVGTLGKSDILSYASRKRELVLGPFVGEPTEHVRIPFGKGICGQAAERKVTIIVQDVTKVTNYLSCSSKVRSEIVVPIFKNGEIVGELDIDSHTISPFTEEDEKFLEDVCEIVSMLF